MALPTIEKTWQFNVNQIVPANASLHDQCSELALNIIASLTGFGSNPVVVAGSSDGVTAGMDAVNRLVDPTDFIDNNAGPHTWFVLEWVTGLQVCMDWSYNTSDSMRRCNKWMSTSGGFTGGSTTARPTAPDEVELAVGRQFWVPHSAESEPIIVDAWHSSDGTDSRIAILNGNALNGMWLFGEAVDAPANFTNPYYGLLEGQGQVSDYSQIYGNKKIYTYRNGGARDLDTTLENVPGQPIMTKIGATIGSDGWPMQPIGLFNGFTAAEYQKLGKIADFWMGATVNNYKTYPADATRQFVQFNNFIFPWNGTVPSLA